MTRSLAVLALLMVGAWPTHAADPAWVAPMKEVHKSFTGTPGTLGLFGCPVRVVA